MISNKTYDIIAANVAHYSYRCEPFTLADYRKLSLDNKRLGLIGTPEEYAGLRENLAVLNITFTEPDSFGEAGYWTNEVYTATREKQLIPVACLNHRSSKPFGMLVDFVIQQVQNKPHAKSTLISKMKFKVYYGKNKMVTRGVYDAVLNAAAARRPGIILRNGIYYYADASDKITELQGNQLANNTLTVTHGGTTVEGPVEGIKLDIGTDGKLRALVTIIVDTFRRLNIF